MATPESLKDKDQSLLLSQPEDKTALDSFHSLSL